MKTLPLAPILGLLLLGAGPATSQTPDNQGGNLIAPKPATNTPLQNDKLLLLDAFGVIPVQTPLTQGGWGAGFNLFGRAFNLGPAVHPQRLQVRFGGGFYISSLMRKTLRNVPLVAPQTGDATVRLNSTIFGMNAIVRFSQPASTKLTPFVDVFAGFRSFNAQMNIRPNHARNDEDASSVQELPSLAQFNYGASAGVSAYVSKHVRFFASGTLTYAMQNARTINVKSATVEAGTVTTDYIHVSKPFVMANLGFSFLLDPKKVDSYDDDCHCRCRGGSVNVRSTHRVRSNSGGGSRVKFSTRSST